MDLTKLYNTIIKINLFKGFNINEIENLLKKIRFQIKSYKKNESIFFRGDPIKHIIILLEGTSKGEMHKFNGDTIIIDYMKPNQIIASAFIFGDIQTFPVDLVSMESSKFLFLDKTEHIAQTLRRSSSVQLPYQAILHVSVSFRVPFVQRMDGLSSAGSAASNPCRGL